MDRKQHRHGRAAPERVRPSPEQQEEQNGIDDVKQDIHHVRRGGPGAKKLRIQHQRKPSERMPVGTLAAGEGPLDVRPRQAAQDMRIGKEITGVVIIEKPVILDGEINRQRRQRQQQANKDRIAKRALLAVGWAVHKGIKDKAAASFQRNIKSFSGTISYSTHWLRLAK